MRPPLPKFRAPLLRWYDRHHRRLPWRAEPGDAPNPYHVLVSEAMLQQTQVATVIDYFNRFISALPDIASLAAADQRTVLRLWQGLGYYRRAINLHNAAKTIITDHAGRIPDTADALLTLPGVGRYTAGAIASIAFNRREPLVDGNVARVLARWFAIRQPIDKPDTRLRLWQAAAELVPPSRPGDFNQALMELGATLCTPRNPNCTACPVRNLCQANRLGLAQRLPVVTPKPRPPAVTHHMLALQKGNRYLLVQRPPTGLWASMWQFPTIENTAKPRPNPAAKQIAAFSHQTTHRSIRFVLWSGRIAKPKSAHAHQWRPLSNLDDLPMSNPQRKAVRLLLELSQP